MNKTELLNWLQNEHQKWEALLDQFGPTRMEQPGVNGTWSMKDVVAHLTGWNRRLMERFQAAQLGEPEPPPPWPAELQTEDEINAWIYESSRGRSLGEVLAESQKAYQQLRAVIEALSTEVRIERVDPAYYLVWIGDQRYLVGEFFDHFRDDHESNIRAWLAQAGKN